MVLSQTHACSAATRALTLGDLQRRLKRRRARPISAWTAPGIRTALDLDDPHTAPLGRAGKIASHVEDDFDRGVDSPGHLKAGHGYIQ